MTMQKKQDRSNMTNSSRRFLSLTLALAAGLCVVGTGLVGARIAGAESSTKSPSQGCVIAVVDLEKLINALKEREDRTKDLEAKFKEMDAKLERLTKEAKSKDDEVSNIKDPTAKAKARKELQEMIIRGEFERQLSIKLLNAQGLESMKAMYEKVDQAAERLAKKNGYDMVMVNDENAPIPGDDEQAMKRAMLLKRMLYVNPTIDITDDLLKMMNNEYAAGR